MAFVIPVLTRRATQGIKRVLTFAASLSLLLSSYNALADQKLTAVADLRYGVALYQYYQKKNLEALTELLVAKQRGGIKGHGDNPEIMEGGFRMAYGMERSAGEIFNRLLDENRPEQTRNAAWFNLATLRYQREDWDQTHLALDKIQGDVNDQIALEKTTLQINLALQQGNPSEAERLLGDKSLRLDRSGFPYLYYNIGSSYSRKGNYEKGIEYYSKLLTMRQYEPEYLALYDKAMTAAGYAQLLSKDHTSAVKYFSKVRLDSPLSSRSLLGYGWAASELGDYALALKPWTALSQRPLIDENTQEVLLAIPFAHEQMGYSGLALKEFQQAEASYLNEMALLEQVINNVQDHSVQQALNIDRSKEINWLDYAKEHKLSPHISYLVALFSNENFVGLVQNLRDLLAIQQEFTIWQGKLGFYQSMLVEREQNRITQLRFVEEEGLEEKITLMEQSRDQLAKQVSSLKESNEFLRLLDEENAAKLERILRAEQNIRILSQSTVQVMPNEELLSLKETVRKQKGFMVWRSQEMYDERLWRAELELKKLNKALTSIRKVQKSVHSIVDKSVDLQGLKQRISISSERLRAQSADIDQAIEDAQNTLKNQVISELRRQHVRLKHYLAQSRLSIARVLDYARTAEDAAPTQASEHSEDGHQDAEGKAQ